MNRFASTSIPVPFFVSLAVFFVLSFVFAQKTRSGVKQTFLFFMGCVFYVTLTDFFIRLPFADDTILILYRLGFFVFCFAGVLYLNFMYAVTETKRGLLFYAFTAVALIASAVVFLPGPGLAIQYDEGTILIMPKAGLSAAMLAACILPAIFSMLLCFHRFRRAEDERHRRSSARPYLRTVLHDQTRGARYLDGIGGGFRNGQEPRWGDYSRQ